MKTRRIISLLLVFVMVTAMMSLTAFATEYVNDGVKYELYNNDLTAVIVGHTSELPANLTIPASVTYGGQNYTVEWIEGDAFAGCEILETVSIPASVEELYPYSFYECVNLTAINVDSGNPNYSSDGGVLFDKNKTTLIRYPEGRSGGYAIPEGVTSIGERAFFSCEKLNFVTVPASVTDIGSNAFYRCSYLSGVSFSPKARLTTIGSYAFYGTHLESVVLPDSVSSIAENAFWCCTYLGAAIIPAHVGFDAFEDLVTVYALAWSYDSFVYDGTDKKPSVQATCRNYGPNGIETVTLVSGTDYSLSYRNADGATVTEAIQPGDYYADFTVENLFAGTLTSTLPFTIKEIPVITVTATDACIGGQTEITVNYPADADTSLTGIPNHPAGLITIKVDNVPIETLNGENGVLVFSLPIDDSFSLGEHTVEVIFNADNDSRYTSSSAETTFNVFSKTPSLSDEFSVFTDDFNTADAATVWYGGNAWRVVGYNGEGVASETGTATLLASGNMGLAYFDDGSNGYTNKYDGSTLKARVDRIAAGFSAVERSAISARTLKKGVYDGENTDCIAGDADLAYQLLWPLSTKEAYALNETLRQADPEHPSWASSYWWLRSPGYSDSSAALVDGFGDVSKYGGSVGNLEFGVRPAFRINLQSVLFTSAAEGGKEGEGVFSPVGDYTGSEWKLTLEDDRHSNFSAWIVGTDGDPLKWRIQYSGAAEGENEYISAVFYGHDKDDVFGLNSKILYYGRLCKAQADPADPDAEPNTITLDLSGLPRELVNFYSTEYGYLCIFNEQFNGDKKTDYASALQYIKIPSSMTLEAEDVTVGEDATIVAILPDNATGPVTFTVDGESYDIYIVDGEAKLTVQGLAEGTYTVYAEYEGDDSFIGSSAETTFAVLKVLDEYEITGLTVDVTPPKGGTTSYDAPPQVTVGEGQHCTISSVSWLYGPNMYTSDDPYLEFSEGETYYIYVLLKADDGYHFEKSAEEGGGIDEGFALFKGCTVNGGSLVFAGSRTFTSEYYNGDFLRLKIAVTAAKGEGRNNPFIDVPEGKWFTDAVLWCYDNGYMTGTSEDTFSPDSGFSRAMFVTVLARIDGADVSTFEGTHFTDVPEGKWYSKPVEWAYRMEYAAGTGNGKFSPSKAVTRETIAQFFYNYSNKKHYDVSKLDDLAAFTDAESVSGWAKTAMQWAVANGLISGTSETTLSPRKTSTRAQVAVIVKNYVENFVRHPIT